jgi:hypothetical protein
MVLALVACAGPEPKPAPSQPAHFAITLEHVGNSWSATCETGCAWTKMNSRKPRLFGRTIRIDDTGILQRGAGPSADATFSISFTADGDNGWKATGQRGTVWTTLGYRCATQGCRARITEDGVGPASG